MKKALIMTVLCTFFSVFAQTQFFNGDQLFQIALENSQALAEKEAAQRAAAFRMKEAATRAAPTVDFESNISYIHNPDTLTVEAGAFGEMDLSGLDPILITFGEDPIEPTPMPEEDVVFEMTGNTYYDFKLIIDQPVFTWGKILNAYNATKAGASAAYEDREKTREQIKTEILINIHILHYLKEIELALSKQNELIRRLERIAADSLNNGMILEADYLEARSSLRESDLAVKKAGQQIRETVLNLTYLTGVELTAVQIETEPFIEDKNASWEDLFGKAMIENRDLAMLRYRAQAEEFKRKAQKGEFYFKPDLAFHMELGYSGSAFPLIEDGWQDDDKGNLTLTLAIRSPIGDGGTMYFAGKAAESDEAAARASLNYGMEQIEKFIRQSLNNIEMNRLNIDYYRDQLEMDAIIIEQKKNEWLTGYGDEREYLSKEINMYSHLISLNRETIQFGTTLYQLDNVTGNVKQ